MLETLRRRLSRRQAGEPIVVVSGLPRSGTSMMMRMLEAGGVPILSDGERQADIDNPKGYYELERVKDLAKDDDKSWLVDQRGKVVKIISYLLRELPPTNNYKVLMMRRDLSEVLASQSKMLVHRGEESESDDGRMLELFKDHLWKARYLVKHQPQFEVLELQYKDVIDNPTAQAEKINEFLGGKLDVAAMTRAVDRGLYRNRAPAS